MADHEQFLDLSDGRRLRSEQACPYVHLVYHIRFAGSVFRAGSRYTCRQIDNNSRDADYFRAHVRHDDHEIYILFFKSHETSRGVIRMRETRGIPIRKLLVEYIDIARQVAKTPRTLLIIGIMVILNITAAVSNNFFALYATQNLGIPDAWLAWFPIGRAIVMLIFIFTIQTALSHLSFRIPVLIGLVLYIASQLILITTKPEQLLPLILYILLEAFAFALVIPQKDSMMVKFIDPVERARVSSIVYMSMIAISSPFGWIAGELSQRDRSWPFIMNMVLFSLCFLLIVYTKRIKLTDNT